MEVILALQALGYDVRAEGDAVHLHFVAGGQPDTALVRPLIAELRQRKADALAYLGAEAAGGRGVGIPPSQPCNPATASAPVMYRSEAEEETWWHQVNVERALAAAAPDELEADIGPGWWHQGDPPEPPPPTHDGPGARNWGRPPVTTKPVWDSAVVDIPNLPAFKAAHGLRTVGAAWLPGDPRPLLFVEETAHV